MKPGYKTSEFWITVVNALLSFLIAIGLITNAESETFATMLIPFVTAVVPIAVYIYSRMTIKNNE